MDQLEHIRRHIPEKLPPIFPTYTKKYKEVIDEDAVAVANLKAKQSGEVESLKAKHEKEVDALKLRHERENNAQKRNDEKEAANDQIQQKNKGEAEARRKEARAKASSTSESVEEGKLVTSIQHAIDLVAQRVKEVIEKDVKRGGIEIFNNWARQVKVKGTLKKQSKGKMFLKMTEELEESYTRSLVNKAIKLIKSPKYFKGDYTGAVKAIEKLKKGLSSDGRVKAALQAANEEWEKLAERNYKKEYKNYHSDPKQIERRTARNAARRLFADADSDKDVHHKDNNPLNNDKSNLSVVTQKYNRTEPRLREGVAVIDKKTNKVIAYYDSPKMAKKFDPNQKYVKMTDKEFMSKYNPRKGGFFGRTGRIPNAKKNIGKGLWNEVLGKDASQKDYIDDFLKSDSPQFKGKTKDKIIQMAVAAYKGK